MFLAYIDPGTGFVVTSAGAWLIALLVSFFGVFLLFFKKVSKFIKKHKKIVIIVLLLIIVIGLITLGVIMKQVPSQFNKKVIILGFDGLSPSIMERLLEDGTLPHFNRLREKGSYRRLATTNPSQSPVAWSAFSTGQNPGKNGVFDFIIRDPSTYGLNLSLSNIVQGKPQRVIKSKCFWEYTSEKKVPTTIITCPISFPPDAIHGKMLSGMGVPDILGTEGTFTFYTTEALPRDKDIGGKVFSVKKSPVMTVHLIGPQVASAGGTAEHTKVPLKVTIEELNSGVSVEYQGRNVELTVGQWSDWQEVTFNLGLLKRAKGIFKFYLVQASPTFSLYISPINFDPRDPFFTISSPKTYSKELAQDIGLYYTQGMPMDTWAVNEGRLTEKPFLEQAEEILREKKAMLDVELNRLQNGILFCYFESSDIIQHMFWRYRDPAHPLYEADAPEEYRYAIERWYKKMDRILGNVMNRINDEDILIVLSDHGFDTFRRVVQINSWLRQNGYLQLQNPRAESGAALLQDIEWSKTKAYAIAFGAIYINQQGRERDGIVAPGQETERLKKELSEKLKGWQDEDGTHIINNVYSREELFWGAYAEQAPDLYIGFKSGYRASWQTALGAVPNTLIEDNLKKWGGTHLLDPPLVPGVVFANRKITKEKPSIYDITPTILKIVGYDKGSIESYNLDGRPLF